MNDLKTLLITLRTMALGLALMLLAIGLMLCGLVLSQVGPSNLMQLFYLGIFLLLAGFFVTLNGWIDSRSYLCTQAPDGEKSNGEKSDQKKSDDKKVVTGKKPDEKKSGKRRRK